MACRWPPHGRSRGTGHRHAHAHVAVRPGHARRRFGTLLVPGGLIHHAGHLLPDKALFVGLLAACGGTIAECGTACDARFALVPLLEP